MADDPKVRVTAVKPHSHGGVQYTPGAIYEVDAATAERLVKQGHVQHADEESPPDVDTPGEPDR